MDLQALKTELTSNYKYRIELHAHTSPASGCSQVTPKDMAYTYKSLGYDAVTVTNHFILSDIFSALTIITSLLDITSFTLNPLS